MAKYGYVSSYYENNIADSFDLSEQLNYLYHDCKISPSHIVGDVFKLTSKSKERSSLLYLLSFMKPNDVIVVNKFSDLFSNVRELMCLLNNVADKKITIESDDIVINSNSVEAYLTCLSISNTNYLQYRHNLKLNHILKTQSYQRNINKGGRAKRVITHQYLQAYNYLKEHTYSETSRKYHLSKSTLYRIKLQVE